MKYLSLFSGIGGIELGIMQSKAYQPECIGYSEIDPYAIQIYEKHFNHKNYGDITKIKPKTLPNFELLIGGFPCQSFSIAGKRGGFKDTRGTLFFEITRIIKEKQPRLLLLENVKGLLSHDQGTTFFTIISTLNELGYDCQWQVLNSKNFGVPQNRERVFIIGHLRGTPRPEVFPIGEANKVYKKNNNQKISTCLDSNYYKGWLDHGQRTMLQDGLKIRRLTPKECERLQGFPDDWTEYGVINKIDLEETIFPNKFKTQNRNQIVEISDTQRYKCLGNAVTVNVIREIIKLLVK